MELAEGIRKIGFQRWHERQLVESHLYLVTAFLCLILVMAGLEGFSFRAPALAALSRLAAMFAGAVLGVVTLRRYTRMLRLAWHAAERSVCGKCETYGILEVICVPTGVRCRKCGNEWTIR